MRSLWFPPQTPSARWEVEGQGEEEVYEAALEEGEGRDRCAASVLQCGFARRRSLLLQHLELHCVLLKRFRLHFVAAE